MQEGGLLCGLNEAHNVEADPGEAFNRIYRGRRPLERFAATRVGAGQTVDDVVAATFEIAWKQISRGVEVRSDGAWLRAIARRVLANDRRSLRRRAALHDRLCLGRQLAGDVFFEVELVDALKRTPPHVATVGILLVHGLGGRELAAILGCSAGAAAMRVHRARALLHECLLDVSDETAALGGRPSPRPAVGADTRLRPSRSATR